MEKINRERREKIMRIFKNLFRSSLDRIENVDKKMLYEDDRNIYEILIEEIKKPFVLNEMNWKTNDKFNSGRKNVSMRNGDKICYLLKNIPCFQRFMKFNQITDENINKAAQFFQYDFIPQRNYLFRQGENPKNFYIILKGSISIRKHKYKSKEEFSVGIKNQQKSKANNLLNQNINFNTNKNSDLKKIEDKINYDKNSNRNLNKIKDSSKGNQLNDKRLDYNLISFKNDIRNSNNEINQNLFSDRKTTSPNLTEQTSKFKNEKLNNQEKRRKINKAKGTIRKDLNNKDSHFKINEISNKNDNLNDYNVYGNKIKISENNNENYKSPLNRVEKANKSLSNNTSKSNISEEKIQEVPERFDWGLLFRDPLELELELSKKNIKNSNSLIQGKQIKGKNSKAKESKLDLQTLLLRSRNTILSNSNNENYTKLITSERSYHNYIKKEFKSEEELVRLSDGMCFGEWGLIYNLPRAASAFTMEDTHILSLDKDLFKYCFFKNMIRAIGERKNFFIKRLPFLRGSTRVEDFLKNINPLYYSNGEVIYTEQDEATSIFLIFQGEGLLQRFVQKIRINSPSDVIDNKCKLKTILKVDRGGIVGLESFTGQKFYSNNLVSYGYTIVFKIPYKLFSYKDDFIVKNFLELHAKQQSILDSIHDGITNNYENTNFKRIKPENLSINYEQKLIERGSCSKNVNLIIDDIKNQKKVYENDFNDFNYLFEKKLDKNYFEMQNSASRNLICNNNDLKIYNSAEEKYSPMKNFKKLKRKSKNILEKVLANEKVIKSDDENQIKLANEIIEKANLHYSFSRSETESRYHETVPCFIDKKHNLFSNINLQTSLNNNFKIFKTEENVNLQDANIRKEFGKDYKPNLKLNISDFAYQTTDSKEEENSIKKNDNFKLKSNINTESCCMIVPKSEKKNKNKKHMIKSHQEIINQKILSKHTKKSQKKNQLNENSLKNENNKLRKKLYSILAKDEITKKQDINVELYKEKEFKKNDVDKEEKKEIHNIEITHNLNTEEFDSKNIRREEEKSLDHVQKKKVDLKEFGEIHQEENEEIYSNTNNKISCDDEEHRIKMPKENVLIETQQNDKNDTELFKSNFIKKVDLNINPSNYKNNSNKGNNNNNYYQFPIKNDKNEYNHIEGFAKVNHKRQRSISKLNVDISLKKESFYLEIENYENKDAGYAKAHITSEQATNSNNKIEKKRKKFDNEKVIVIKRNFSHINKIKINVENLLTENDRKLSDEIQIYNEKHFENSKEEKKYNIIDIKEKKLTENQSFEFDERKQFEKHRPNSKEKDQDRIIKKSHKKDSTNKILKLQMKSNKNLKKVSDLKSNNTSFENNVNSQNNSNHKTNKNSTFTKIIYDFISPNNIFKEKFIQGFEKNHGENINEVNYYNKNENVINRKKNRMPLRNNFQHNNPIFLSENKNRMAHEMSPFIYKSNIKFATSKEAYRGNPNSNLEEIDKNKFTNPKISDDKIGVLTSNADTNTITFPNESAKNFKEENTNTLAVKKDINSIKINRKNLNNFFITNTENIPKSIKKNNLNINITNSFGESDLNNSNDIKFEKHLSTQKIKILEESEDLRVKHYFSENRENKTSSKCKFFNNRKNTYNKKFQLNNANNNIIDTNIDKNLLLKLEKNVLFNSNPNTEESKVLLNNNKNENSDNYEKQKLVHINNIIDRDIEKLSELRENILDFKICKDFKLNPLYYQEDIDRAKVIVDNNKKEYTTNYKAFSNSNKSIKKNMFKGFCRKSENLINSTDPKRSSSGKLDYETTCNNTNANTKRLDSHRNLHQKNLLEGVNFIQPEKEDKNKLSVKGNLDIQLNTDKKNKKFTFPLLKDKIKNKFNIDSGKSLTDFYSTKKDLNSIKAKVLRNGNYFEDDENCKVRKIINVFQSEFQDTKNLVVNHNNNIYLDLYESYSSQDNNFSCQYNSNIFVNDHHKKNKKEFSFTQTKNFFSKHSNKNLKVMVSKPFSNKNSGGTNLKDVQPLSKIYNQWVMSSKKVNDFNTGTFSLPLFFDADRNKK